LPVATVLPIDAVPVQFQSVIAQGKPVSGRHFLLKPFNGGGLKLNDLVAFIADQVIVVLFVKHVVKNRPIVLEMALLTDSDFAQKIQGSINRGQAHAPVLLPGNLMVQLLGRDMVDLEKGLQNRLPLLGELQALFRKVIPQEGDFFVQRRSFQRVSRRDVLFDIDSDSQNTRLRGACQANWHERKPVPHYFTR
jgi:hypothetical protein